MQLYNTLLHNIAIMTHQHNREICAADASPSATPLATATHTPGEPLDSGTAATAVQARVTRVAVSVFFLLHGLCFASWASRIPTFQSALQLSESALGTILFALPMGFFISLPFSGWLIARLSSRRVVLLSSTGYALSLLGIGFSNTGIQIFAALLIFGFFANMLNISMNTQAVAVERIYGKRLLATFHGLWSLAGFASAALGTWMIGLELSPRIHFTFIALVFVPGIILAGRHLIKHDEQPKEKLPLLAMPDKALLGLGLIAFCSMMVEGGMFDWSGVYMSKVVHADKAQAALGYTLFMIAMAAMRFAADSITVRFGLKRTLQGSGMLAATGLLLAVAAPQYTPAILGLILVGMGVSSVVPMVYSAAGRSRTLSAGTAITAVSSLGFMGFLIGPPAIGYLAAAVTLRGSFIGLAVMALCVVILASVQRFGK